MHPYTPVASLNVGQRSGSSAVRGRLGKVSCAALSTPLEVISRLRFCPGHPDSIVDLQALEGNSMSVFHNMGNL